MIFEPIIPIWGIFLVVALGAALAYHQYGKGGLFGVKTGHRMALLGIKVSIFAVLGFLLLNPYWVRKVKTERPARIAALFDTSESMNSIEGPGKPTAFAKLRDAFFRQVYPILQDRADIRFYTFSSKLATIDVEELRTLENTGGAATNIRGAIQDTLSQQGSSPPAAIVLLTDGNHNWGPDPTVDILRPPDREEPVPLIAVSTAAYGELKRSLAIPQVTLPAPVFSDEDTEVRFQVVASGARGEEAKVTLEMTRENESGEWEPLEDAKSETRLPLLGASSQGRFPVRFPQGGKYRVQLTAEAEGIGSASTVEEVFVEPGRWRVAYYVGRPGWMNAGLITRLANVPRYAMRVAIDRGKLWSYVVTGRSEIGGETKEGEGEKAFLSLEDVAYDADLIILEGLEPDQLSQLPAETIKQRLEEGAALLIICGKAEPMTQGALARIGASQRVPASAEGGILAPSKRTIRFTDRTAKHPVTSSPLILGVGSFLPLAEIPYSQITAANDAEVLIVANDDSPVLATLSLGNQRSAFIGADDFWRWRFQPGNEGERLGQAYEVLIDRLIRWLILGEQEDTSVPNIMISQSRIPLGKSIEIGVQYGRAVSEASATVHLSVTSPNQQVAPVPLTRKPGGFFSARFTASDPGEYLFLASDPERPEASDTAKIQVEPFSIETAITGSRDDLLRKLCEGSGGLWMDVKDIGEIVKSNRLDKIYEPRVVVRSINEPVMASPWLFVILVTLLCSEWTLRRLRDLP